MAILKKKLSFVYEKAEQEIEAQILDGRLKAGDCVLSENAICSIYGISRRSARSAIENLIRKGLLYRRPGKGTFVSSLKSGTGNRIAEFSIALIIPDISDLFILKICEGIQAAANQYNCNLVIKTSNGDIDRENQNIHYSIQRQEDGVIIFPNYGRFNVEELWRLKDSGLPFVLIDRYFEDIDTNYVGVDNIRGGYLATSHLIRLGHRRIAHLYGSRGSANDGRLAGYRQALSDNEIPCNEKWIRRFEDLALKSGGSRFEPDVECGYENMKHLLRFSEIPTAVFAGNDYQALGAVKAIKEQRLRIPEDIAIVGFDELTINPFLEIPLTTIRQPIYEIGRNAVEILLRKIAEQDTGKRASTERIILPVELVIGASCGAKCRKRRHGWA